MSRILIKSNPVDDDDGDVRVDENRDNPHIETRVTSPLSTFHQA